VCINLRLMLINSDLYKFQNTAVPPEVFVRCRFLYNSNLQLIYFIMFKIRLEKGHYHVYGLLYILGDHNILSIKSGKQPFFLRLR